MPTTAWLKPPKPIDGQDHLGTIAVCEALYSQLLPGITNVTDRARCYSFYPWFIWRLEEANLPKDPKLHTELLRRAECLWCLIALAHENGGDSWEHGATLAGRNTLAPAWGDLAAGATLPLSRFAADGGEPGAYFQAAHGGFSAYYLGTLRNLQIADLENGFLRFYRQRGGPLAQALDDGVDGARFFAALQEEAVSRETILQLASFCPCHLTANPPEQQALIQLFFNAPGIYHAPQQEARRETLLLLLDLIGAARQSEDTSVSVETLRASLYSGALLDGHPWTLSPALQAARERWAIYQRTDLLSVAVQTLFWGMLDGLQEEAAVLPNASAAAQWVLQRMGPQLGYDLALPFPALLDQVQRGLPPLGRADDPAHEIAKYRGLVALTRRRDNRSLAVQSAIAILLALVARDRGAVDPHVGFALEPGFVQRYPINLATLRHHAQTTWHGSTAGQVLTWLVEWVLDTHVRVALYKLRSERRDTFRIRPEHDGFHVIGPWRPAYSQPRLDPALQILRDLGATTRTPAGGTALTALGRTLRGGTPDA